jgi:hypothetical protein
MVNKKIFLLLVLSIILIGIVAAEDGVSYCCEKTNEGAWCQNAPEEECDRGDNCGFNEDGSPAKCRLVPTSCEATSYCKLGVCINSREGTCLKNTPQKVCEKNGGLWDDRDKEEIPQCQLGCCLIGDQSAFTTLTRCKQLSSIYGLEINYKTDIQNEVQCITSARPKVKGACVFNKEFEKTCELLTKSECNAKEETDFYEGYLCSATTLETNCGPRGGTTCVEGKDEVYFLDTCGNLANVYDADRKNEEIYWTYLAGYEGIEVCNPASSRCGNCDYYLGSTCGLVGGKHICKDLNCEYKGDDYLHGETWCAESTDDEMSNSPGGKHFRLLCYNGEVLVEPCAEFRQEVCIQSSIGDFKTAGCRANMWQDCSSQKNKKDCRNEDRRDCRWISTEEGKCVPKYSPGFNFWEEETEADTVCATADQVCHVDYYAGVAEGALITLVSGVPPGWKVSGDSSCLKDCESTCTDPFHICEKACRAKCPSKCVDENGKMKDSWKKEMNEYCISLGDCGVKVNYIGEKGYNDEDKNFVEENNLDKNNGPEIFGSLGEMFG